MYRCKMEVKLHSAAAGSALRELSDSLVAQNQDDGTWSDGSVGLEAGLSAEAFTVLFSVLLLVLLFMGTVS